MAEKNEAAALLGRLGGAKGGKARAARLTRERLSEIGRLGARIRWEKRKLTCEISEESPLNSLSSLGEAAGSGEGGGR